MFLSFYEHTKSAFWWWLWRLQFAQGKLRQIIKKNTVICKILAISLMKMICRNILTHIALYKSQIAQLAQQIIEITAQYYWVRRHI